MRRLLTFLSTLRTERRGLGWKGLLKKRGWVIVVVVVVYYLVRDTLLYIVGPLLLVAAGLLR
ncbi:MAG: hypothetical protein ACREMV_14375 [Gemmatimonadales bacterium]